jgi:hypothetical protein
MNQPLEMTLIQVNTQAQADWLRARMAIDGHDMSNVEWRITELASAVDPLAIAGTVDLDRSYSATQAVLSKFI